MNVDPCSFELTNFAVFGSSFDGTSIFVFNPDSTSIESSKSDSMVQFSDHVLHVAMSPIRGFSKTAMEVQVPCGKRCRMKRLTAMHASFIEEAFDTFGALPPKA